MKKYLSLLLIAALLSALFVGCTKAPPAPAPDVPAVTNPATTPEDPAAPADEGTPDIALEEMEITLYLPNEMADGFDEKKVTVPGTPQDFVDALIENGALPTGIRVNSFDFGDEGVATQDGNMVSHTPGSISHINLDVSGEFQEALRSVGTAGESMYVGSLVNTLLRAYDAQSITITCDGEIIETGHAVYDLPLEFFEMDTAQ